MTTPSESSADPVVDPAAPDWSALARPVPEWFTDAKLGIFIHWGPYSVPAWAEPTGELGAVDWGTWFRHNPYAEWYFNTIRFPDSPAHEHHAEGLRRRAVRRLPRRLDHGPLGPRRSGRACSPGPAPATSSRPPSTTTASPSGTRPAPAPATPWHRGPHRDLVGDLADAVRTAGLRFGVYYSGGLDWHVSDFPPLDSGDAVGDASRPKDAAYAAYAYLHVQDLIERYAPDVLWNDIEWPDAGKHNSLAGPLRAVRALLRRRSRGRRQRPLGRHPLRLPDE